MATTGFPDANSTGVPAGTKLTTYTGPMTITQAGTVIEGQIINGSLRVTAPNVIIKNCVIKYGDWWGIDAEGAKNITVQNCDITGPGYSGAAKAAILGSGTFIGNDVSKSENGIVLTGGASTVKGNFIHDLAAGGNDPHYDGIEMHGGQNGVLIEGNTVIGRDTSDVFMKNHYGPINDVTVKGNLLLGDAGYQVYVDGRDKGGAITGVSIVNNHVEKGGYGHYSIDKASPVMSGNIEYAHGKAPAPGGITVTPTPPAETTPEPLPPATDAVDKPVPPATDTVDKPLPPASASGFPDASTAGVPAGTNLTTYSGPMTITKAGTVIEGQIINGSLRVTASDVIIKNCVIKYDGWWGIDAEGAKNITIQNCDITGPGYAKNANAAILGSGNFIGNDISKSENGIVLTGGASTVKGNFVHDLQAAGADPHYDGITAQGGQNGVLIEGNTVISRDTSAIFIKNNFGSINNVTVKGNLLLGDAGYQVYVDGRDKGGPITGVSIVDNHIEKGGYGYYSIDNSSPTVSGNTEYAKGQAPKPGGLTPVPPVDATPNPTPPPAEKPVPPTTDPVDKPVPPETDPVEKPVPPVSTIDQIIHSSKGNHVLIGGDGNDLIYSHAGKNVMTGGGGADHFIFTKASDLGSGKNSDIITDFQQGQDKIDLSQIDANGKLPGKGAFHFIAQENARFDFKPGALAWHLQHVGGKDITVIQADLNGDGVQDFEIQLQGAIHLNASDFIL